MLLNHSIGRRILLFLLLPCLFTRIAFGAGGNKPTEAKPIRVVVWDEQQPQQKPAYDNFLGNAIAEHLRKQPGLAVKSVRLDDPEQGLPDEVLEQCDVLVWWGHVRNREVKETLAKKIVERIKAGKLSMVTLHSAHWSQPFIAAMYDRTTEDALKDVPAEKRKDVKISYVHPRPYIAPKRGDPVTPSVEHQKNPDGSDWLVIKFPNCVFPAFRADGKPSHVRTLIPEHPIAKDVPQSFDIPQTEMYDEPFNVPAPDAVIFEEHWDGGEHFRSGCLWNIGRGKVFYFRPGHETYPVYKQEIPLKIVENAVKYLGGELAAGKENVGESRQK